MWNVLAKFMTEQEALAYLDLHDLDDCFIWRTLDGWFEVVDPG